MKHRRFQDAVQVSERRLEYRGGSRWVGDGVKESRIGFRARFLKRVLENGEGYEFMPERLALRLVPARTGEKDPLKPSGQLAEIMEVRREEDGGQQQLVD
jgi:hypothetical protein